MQPEVSLGVGGGNAEAMFTLHDGERIGHRHPGDALASDDAVWSTKPGSFVGQVNTAWRNSAP